MSEEMPWVIGLTDEEVQELRKNKQELAEYGKEKLKNLMNKEPNGDFIKDYPDVTRVEVIDSSNGREYVRYECSNVQVSLQDDGQTIKIFLFSTDD